MDHLKKTYKSIIGMAKEINAYHIGAFAAQSAFFLIMAFVPMMLLVASVLSVFDLDLLKLLYCRTTLSEKSILYVRGFLEEISSHKRALISLGTVFTAWSAGKAFYALSEGFHSILGIRDERNYFVLRLKGLVSSFIFALVISSVVIIGIFGESVIDFFMKIIKHNFISEEIANIFRRIYIFFSFLLVMILLYGFLPDWASAVKSKKLSAKPKITHILGICVILTVFIYVFTVGFSVYILRFSTFGITYGSFAVLIGVMLWLYILMYSLLIGFSLLTVRRFPRKQS